MLIHNMVRQQYRRSTFLPYSPSTVLSKLCPTTSPQAIFTNSEGVQVNIPVTPETGKRIDETVQAILEGISPSKKPYVLQLKKDALSAVADNQILNRELASTIRAAEQEKQEALEQKRKNIASRKQQREYQKNIAQFAKAVYKELPKDINIFNV